MLDIFVTVDVEVWTDGWDLRPSRFPEYFSRYILGSVSGEERGLRYQLETAKQHGLKFVFFVEPLFAWEFGTSPLRDIVSMIKEYGQGLELHLHPEWSSKSTRPILEQNRGIRLLDYPMEEQSRLIALGLELLAECGVEDVCAFRAGSFGANEVTLTALARNHIAIDSSFNLVGPCGSMFREPFYGPRIVSGIHEFPLTVFRDFTGRLRAAQLGSSSARELKTTMSQAEDEARSAYVLLSHSFELLNAGRTRSDPVVIRRFEEICGFLASHRDRFRTRWFSDAFDATTSASVDEPLVSPRLATLGRYAEQVVRRLVAQ